MSGSTARGGGTRGSRPRPRNTKRSTRGQSTSRLALLAVEQDHEVVRLLIEALVGQPIELQTCDDAAEALLILGRAAPDVILLGPVRGRLDPVDFITIARSDDPDVAILAGAGRDCAEFAAGAASAGATAVIQRPYRSHELIALLRSLAPHLERLRARPDVIDLGRLRIDGSVPQFWLDGRRVSVPPMEFLLLRYFAERAGQVISRTELLEAVWGGDQHAQSNTLTVHIMRLRKRLGDDEGASRWIRAIRGMGYQFSVPAEGGGSGPLPTVPSPRDRR